MDPAVSVIVVTWNSASTIAACLTSLRDSAPSVDYEVVLVDNGSQDATLDQARAADPGIVTIPNGTNRGLAAANNQGMRASRGGYFLISNPDVLFRPGTVDALIAAAERHPRAAFIIPRLLYDDGRVQTSVGDMPSLREAILGRWALRRMAHGEQAGFWWDGWAHDREVEVGHGMECCYLVRREAVEDIGPQNERFVLDWEGPEWTRRAHAAGWQIWFTPEAEAVHLGGVSVKQALPRWVVSSHRGMYMYFARDTRPVLRPLLALAFVARATIKLIAVLRRGRLYDAGFEPR